MFRFEAMWTKEKGCKDVVERAWRLSNATDGMLGISEKIQCCGELLSAWNKQHFGNVYTQLKKAKHESKRLTEMAPNRLSQESMYPKAYVKNGFAAYFDHIPISLILRDDS
ncbi:unnamed protein product [Fraxinus pennsylvanica]|uniref:Uncharacterized protein n=1 Tax=Fraxinus pennsylvanica TaxID=56036 RepID=A0AAD2DUM4_9LAMI|nr:unnamed protein product [Fraxinus pennsylvanica]